MKESFLELRGWLRGRLILMRNRGWDDDRAEEGHNKRSARTIDQALTLGSEEGPGTGGTSEP